jgi:hypothetical protein
MKKRSLTLTISHTAVQAQYNPNPKYVYLHPSSGYIFRLCVPKALRKYVGQSEFRYSLRTGSIQRAAHRAQQIAAYIHRLFNDIRMKVAAHMSQTIPDTVASGGRTKLCFCFLYKIVQKIGIFRPYITLFDPEIGLIRNALHRRLIE